MSDERSPLALPATSKGPTERQEGPTDWQENRTEQHGHHFLDLSCHLCKGCRRHREGRGGGREGRLEPSVGFTVTGMRGLGRRWQGGQSPGLASA